MIIIIVVIIVPVVFGIMIWFGVSALSKIHRSNDGEDVDKLEQYECEELQDQDSKNRKMFNKNDPKIRAKHRNFIEQCKQQDLEDGDLRKFAKSGTIFIPHAVQSADFLKKCEAPDNIQLEKVVYDPSGNEVFDIGSDVDNIELNPETSAQSEIQSKLSTELANSSAPSASKTPKSKN